MLPGASQPENFPPTQQKHMYITALATAHQLAGMKSTKPGRLTQLILAGGRNLETFEGRFSTPRRSLNLTVQKIIGHRIAVSNWSSGSKQVVWTAITTAFFSSARMGELLSPKETNFDPTASLLWGQVFFQRDGRVLIHIRQPKISSKEGDFLDLFPFADKVCCPVLTLKKLYEMHKNSGLFYIGMPVFCFPSGKNLTLKCLNAVLKGLLGDIYKEGTDSITCHSLRMAIPTALNEAPSSTSNTDTKEWGRWKSNAHLAYAKLHKKHKLQLFGKITNALTNL